MAKARPRKPPGGPTDGASGGTANGRGEAGTSDAPAEATMAPEVLYLDEKAVYQPEGSEYPGQETDFDQPGYGQPGGAGSASQWPSAGAAGWDGDGTGVWDAATEWGADDQGEAWDEQDGWDGGPEAGTWEQEEGDEEAWVGPTGQRPGTSAATRRLICVHGTRHWPPTRTTAPSSAIRDGPARYGAVLGLNRAEGTGHGRSW